MITLKKIEDISFRKAGFNGYRTEDVDDFVDDVIEKVRSLEQEKELLELKIEEYKKKEDSVQSVLINAEMSAKQTEADAQKKSQEILDEAQAKADSTVEEAQKKADAILSDATTRADQINSDTDAKVQELMDKALKESADQIEENNRIIEEQKKNIIKLMGEASKFRNSLISTYKEHLGLINSIFKNEDVRNKKKELDDEYPTYETKADTAAEAKADGEGKDEPAQDEEKKPENKENEE